MSLMRYPGGKAKLKKQILGKLRRVWSPGLEFRDSFFGGGSVPFYFLENFPSEVWINDRDPGVACLWTSVIRYPGEFKQIVRDYSPRVEDFDAYKASLLALQECPQSKEGILHYGSQKLKIAQISYSGLGTMSGGPLGGRQQGSAYKIDCRWSPGHICKQVDKLHALLFAGKPRHGACTCLDFQPLLEDPKPAILFLDPPYYEKGNDLYQYSFSAADHVRLALLLKKTPHPWVLTYDDCDEIRFLYREFYFESVSVNYSITASKEEGTGRKVSRSKPELLICSPQVAEVLSDARESA